MTIDRRRLLALAAASAVMPPSISRAWAIDADKQTGTIQDVAHVVILMQENRSFDHYFGTMNGVRGFADRFPIPLPDAPGAANRNVWTQHNAKAKAGEPALVAPFPLNTKQTFAHMRVEGTPHSWADAQHAWDEGRMHAWPEHKGAHAMGHYVKDDIPFQWALADAFTLCDAYHCSFQGGTNTNRLFLWTGTNDPHGQKGGPSISNSHDRPPKKPGEEGYDKDAARDPYLWTTYVERLDAAGVSWRIYEDMADNFGDNPVIGFKTFRESLAKAPGSNPRLAELGWSTRHLDGLKADVIAGKLPQVSYVVSLAKDSEHPGPSSPAQGADYVARVLDALTANPDVWARTVFLVMYDENDGFFDHLPPPAAPSLSADGTMRGASTLDIAGELHMAHAASEASAERPAFNNRPYGLGPRVPLFVISPWSRGGWVSSEVFDHTSVIRFLEARFGVMEPNISPWRRAVCGDLTSAFDFADPNETRSKPLPKTAELAARAAALPGHTTPPTPARPAAPAQAAGPRRSRALPYRFEADFIADELGVRLVLANKGSAAGVLHVYDRLRLAEGPWRYTLGKGGAWLPTWTAGPYDFFVLGPNGFHRRFTGDASKRQPGVTASTVGRKMVLRFANLNDAPLDLSVTPNAYAADIKPIAVNLERVMTGTRTLEFDKTWGWHDISITSPQHPGWLVRIASRLENGKPSMTDPAMSGAATMAI